MEPSLRAGDRVTIEGIEPSSLRCGDIVVYESPLAGLVVHRLVWKVPPFDAPVRVYTKGDALPHLDRPVAVRGILGRVVEVEDGKGRRKLRRSTSFMRWVLAAGHWGWRRGFRLGGR